MADSVFGWRINKYMHILGLWPIPERIPAARAVDMQQYRNAILSKDLVDRPNGDINLTCLHHLQTNQINLDQLKICFNLMISKRQNGNLFILPHTFDTIYS